MSWAKLHVSTPCNYHTAINSHENKQGPKRRIGLGQITVVATRAPITLLLPTLNPLPLPSLFIYPPTPSVGPIHSVPFFTLSCQIAESPAFCSPLIPSRSLLPSPPLPSSTWHICQTTHLPLYLNISPGHSSHPDPTYLYWLLPFFSLNEGSQPTMSTVLFPPQILPNNFAAE